MELGRIPLFIPIALSLSIAPAPGALAARKPTPTRTPTITATRTPTPASTRTPTPTPAPGAVSIAITAPVAGATIDSNQFNVRGTFQGPPNTGITVNDRVAYVSGTRFMLNGLPLAAGANPITATATTPAGQSATAAVTATATGAPPDLVLNADVTSGISPLTVTFTYEFRSTQAVQKLAIDFDGDGHDDFSTRKPPTTVQNTYTNPGLYAATLTITDSLGRAHKAEVGIEVSTGDARDALFRSVWDAMNEALARGDLAAALRSWNPRAQEKYAPIFNDLISDMPGIVGSYSPPQFVSEGPGYLEYAINRVIDGENHVFLVYLLRDADGVWRMDSM